MSLANRFKSVERQRIILYLIEKALGGDCEDYAMTTRARQNGEFHVFPTHDPKTQADLNNEWVNTWWQPQPLDWVREYFGEVGQG